MEAAITTPAVIDNAFVEQVRRDMLAFAQLQLRDAALAEDAVQDALTAALTSGKGEGGEKADGFHGELRWVEDGDDWSEFVGKFLHCDIWIGLNARLQYTGPGNIVVLVMSCQSAFGQERPVIQLLESCHTIPLAHSR